MVDDDVITILIGLPERHYRHCMRLQFQILLLLVVDDVMSAVIGLPERHYRHCMRLQFQILLLLVVDDVMSAVIGMKKCTCFFYKHALFQI